MSEDIDGDLNCETQFDLPPENNIAVPCGPSATAHNPKNGGALEEAVETVEVPA